MDIRCQSGEFFAQLLLVLYRLGADQLGLVIREGRFGSQHEAQDGSRDGPVVCMAGEQQGVEEDSHQVWQDVRLRLHVLPNQLHRRLILILVEEHVRGDVIDRAGTLRTNRQLYREETRIQQNHLQHEVL